MRSEAEIKSLVHKLEKVTNNSPSNYEDWEFETCRCFLACLRYVLGEFDEENLMGGLPFYRKSEKLSPLEG